MTPTTTLPTPAPTAAAAPPERRSSGAVRAIVENVEALAIAIVMALILKFFLIEAYKIPTGSMQPGIMGDQVAGVFDRVLVNKLVYMLRDPERYEVIVFKNPLWQRQNYIKRLVGLPGERIELRNGDVFVTPPGGGDEAIARKPDDVWRAVRKNLLSERDGRLSLGHHLESDDREVKISPDRIVFGAAGNAPVSLRTRQSIRDHYLDGYEPEWVEAYDRPPSPYVPAARYKSLVSHDVTDLEIAADVTPALDAKSIRFEILESGRLHQVDLPVGAGSGVLTTVVEDPGDRFEWEDQAADASVPALEPGVTTRVSLRNVDDEIVLELDDEVVLRRAYLTRGLDPAVEPRTRAHHLTRCVVRAAGSFTLTDVGLWRDIHYLPDGDPHGASSAVYVVPDGEYLVLGDNTQNSWDCRQWEVATYRLADGRVITGNYFQPNQARESSPDSNPAVDGPWVHFRNVYGQEYVFADADVRGRPDVERVQSFPKELLLGKALAVFWPLPPFAPTWRLKWLR